jgi:hypothetical protein
VVESVAAMHGDLGKHAPPLEGAFHEGRIKLIHSTLRRLGDGVTNWSATVHEAAQSLHSRSCWQ